MFIKVKGKYDNNESLNVSYFNSKMKILEAKGKKTEISH